MSFLAKNTPTEDHLRVLIVDDDPIALEILANALKDFGYSVDVASNGKEALERLRWFSPRIVISDVDMPEMGGVETMQGHSQSSIDTIHVYHSLDIALGTRERPAWIGCRSR